MKKYTKPCRTSGVKYLQAATACCIISWQERNAHGFQELHWLHATIMEWEFDLPAKYKHTLIKPKIIKAKLMLQL